MPAAVRTSRRIASANARTAPAPAPVRALRGTVLVTRQVHFNAAHRLDNPDRSEAWNRDHFGPCNNPRWHGHNYVLEVTVKGEPHPETGYVIDLGLLRDVLQRAVIEPCDHRNLNEEVPFLHGIIPTSENLVIAFWGQIAPALPSGRLHCVRLFETPRNFAEYFGPAAESPVRR
jgi:6-pyruvoyltetrahydropterin/6-carboxytetrahydropterin synthase